MINATQEQKERLKNLSEHREERIIELAEIQMDNVERSGLDPKTHSLCRFATLVAIDAPLASYAWQLAVADDCGVAGGKPRKLKREAERWRTNNMNRRMSGSNH